MGVTYYVLIKDCSKSYIGDLISFIYANSKKNFYNQSGGKNNTTELTCYILKIIWILKTDTKNLNKYYSGI